MPGYISGDNSYGTPAERVDQQDTIQMTDALHLIILIYLIYIFSLVIFIVWSRVWQRHDSHTSYYVSMVCSAIENVYFLQFSFPHNVLLYHNTAHVLYR